MPTHLQFVTEPAAIDPDCSLLWLGRKGALSADACTPHRPAGASDDLWAALLKRAEPGDQSRAVHTTLGDAARPLTLGVLPEVCSRHNSPSRAWGVPSLVRAAAGRSVGIVAVPTDPSEGLALALAIASALPSFSLSSRPSDRTVQVCVLGGDRSAAEYQAAADAVRAAAALVDRPPSHLNVSDFVEEARQVAERHSDAQLTVIRAADLVEAGLGGVHAVGKAASDGPALVVLDHGTDGPDECWVGKGIVYDTGGLSIKSKTGMPGMKADMGGAAAILAAFEAAVNLGSTRRLTAILCLAENAVGPDATRPDDVIHMYSGKTVEVNNTDAEGRLVLADGVAWAARNRNPARIVDLATLTGAQGVSTGQQIAALFCNDEATEQLAVRLGRASGDLCHPLPYVPEFHRAEFKSPVADMKNSVKNRNNAQSSCAGQFIGNHLFATDFDGAWLHVDMAGPSTRAGRGTGYGVGLLLSLIGLGARDASQG